MEVENRVISFIWQFFFCMTGGIVVSKRGINIPK